MHGLINKDLITVDAWVFESISSWVDGTKNCAELNRKYV